MDFDLIAGIKACDIESLFDNETDTESWCAFDFHRQFFQIILDCIQIVADRSAADMKHLCQFSRRRITITFLQVFY